MTTPSQSGSYCKIELSRGMSAIVDESDFEWISSFSWTANPSGPSVYARRAVRLYGKSTKIYMHRFILGIEEGKTNQVVDHINKNTLDNRRSNLRIVTTSQNLCNSKLRIDNSSGVKGVTWDAARCKWKVQIKSNATFYQMRFESFEQAVENSRIMRERLHGEFASLG